MSTASDIRSLVDMKRASRILSGIFKVTNPDKGHDLQHALNVCRNAERALLSKDYKIQEWQREAVLLASLIHDVDDLTFSKGEAGFWRDIFLHEYFESPSERRIHPELCSVISRMIELVSSSENGDVRDTDGEGRELPEWYFIVRYANRLEASGFVGIRRAVLHGRRSARLLHDSVTERVFNDGEIDKVASLARCQRYAKNLETKLASRTTIDHFYDKILHLNVPSWMENPYLHSEMEMRNKIVRRWIVHYWNHFEHEYDKYSIDDSCLEPAFLERLPDKRSERKLREIPLEQIEPFHQIMESTSE